MELFDKSLSRLERQQPRSETNTQHDESFDDNGYSDGEDPGPVFVMNENLVLNPSDESDESEFEEPAKPKQSKATNKSKKFQETDVEPERTQKS
jgi:hypothetical protein